MHGRLLRILVGAVATVAASALTAAAPHPSAPQASFQPLIDDAFRAAYNLDHDDAIALARKAVAMAPEEPATHQALAAALWLKILFHRGAVTVDNFLGGLKSQQSLPKAPPELEAEFKREIARAASLAEAQVAKDPKSAQAQSAAGSAYALQASYTASVEGSLIAAFKTARRAYDAHETVLEREPNRGNSRVVVGTYRYLVAGLSLPSRMFAYVAGFGGGKEKGISMIESARADPASRVEATVSLVLIYTREKRHGEVATLVRLLMAEYPRNRLLVLEEGAALSRAARWTEAETALTRGIEIFERDARPKIPGERALWHYKRGAARVALNRPADAATDLRLALEQHPVEWVRGRLHLELGKLADLAGRRDAALAEYRQAKAIGESSQDAAGASEAGRLIRRPFTTGGAQ